MKTIVKGKVLYRSSMRSSVDEARIRKILSFYPPEHIKRHRNNVLKSLISYGTDYDYETFYTTDNINYTLSVGDYIHINEETYRIEKVEGTDKDCVIYYINKIIKECNNHNYNEQAKEINKLIDEYIENCELAKLDGKNTRKRTKLWKFFNKKL